MGRVCLFCDTLAGRTKPNRVSCFLWALAPLVSLGAAFSVDADIWASVRVLVGGVVPGVIFLGSFFNRKIYWQLTWFDWFCGACLCQHCYLGSSQALHSSQFYLRLRRIRLLRFLHSSRHGISPKPRPD